MSNDRPQRVRHGAPIRRPHPGRTLVVLAVIVVLLFGAVGAGTVWGQARWSPGLALDLEGGTEVVLQARATEGAAPVDAEQMEQAAAIIRQRVDSTGLSESEVQVQGGTNISVSIPGQATRQQLDLIAQSALLRMRVVLYEAPGAPAATTAAPTDPAASPTGSDPAAPVTPGATASAPATSAPAPSASPSTSATGAAAPEALRQAATPTASPTATPSASATGSAAPTSATPTAGTGPGQPTDTPSPAPTDASDKAWYENSADVLRLFTDLDCSNPANRTGGIVDDPKNVLVTCSQDGATKYVLGPAEIEGTQLTGASSGQATNDQGRVTGGWQVNLEFDSTGGTAFQNLTQRISALDAPRNEFAAVLDGLVVTAPQVSSVIPGGKAQITGQNFTEASADALAQQLKFGALPLSFEVQTTEQVSATLGSEQLQRGLIAGLIGLVLVVAYSLLQYRGLGLVTVGSLLLAAALNWGVILLLSWLQGFRLSLAGVAGLIVAIGVTADSFILFFERVRDEIRDGRILSSAVEAGWRRARRTILISDAVSLLSAVVLYVLAAGNVRGFAYTLGITTVIDIVIVFLFTHPVVALLGRTKFFGGGHKWSGFDPEHLGSVVARNALHSGTPRPTLASLRAQERERARAGGGTTVVEDHDGSPGADERDGGNA